MDEYTRTCPNCQCLITYTNKYVLAKAINNATFCMKCKTIKTSYDYRKEDVYRNNRKKEMVKRYDSGWTAPFKGKSHTDEFKHNARLRQLSIVDNYKTPEFRKKISNNKIGDKNPMYGKSVYMIWLNKYGKEIADNKMIEYKAKLSKASGGENNAMYGKPTPQGSGVGWKGCFDNIFFRSLRELSYMINLKENNIKFINGETLKIPYISAENRQRTYRPDFILPDYNTIVEIKPLKLINSPTNLLKMQALSDWCNINGYIAEILDVMIDYDKIKTLFDLNRIVFNKKYEDKFRSYLK